jgi:tRNA-uridine 2-sulfurtransferase
MAIEVTGDSARGPDWAFARLVVEGDRIVQADAPGMARPLDGLTLLEAAAVPGETLAADAVANALGSVFHASPDPDRIAVAMSGGVDSAVSLHRAGRNAVGVTLRLWLDPHGPDAERACCSPSAVVAARETCHALGLPHVTLDLRPEFHAAVVTPFVEGYARAETPNPCSRCNGSFRFDALVAFAKRAGARRLWTGHYARIVARDGLRLVARGADPAKDQSYMLATVSPDLLAGVEFPLGDQTKAETRREAAAASLAAAGRRESQEACFLAGADYRAFLERAGLVGAPGPIVDENGNELGRHDGVWRYTPGQRRGLGLAAAEPLYTLRADAATATLVVGPKTSLATTTVDADGPLHVDVVRAEVKVRYRSPAVEAAVERTPTGFRLTLAEPAYGVARGQIAALYDDGGAVVGSGIIRSAGR